MLNNKLVFTLRGGPKSLIFEAPMSILKIPLNLLKNGTENNNTNPKRLF